MAGAPEAPWTGPAISVRDVVVSYDGRRVLDGINLDISRGETMVLLGGSGSGKSTLLRQMIGLERPQSGQILVNGVDIAKCTRQGAEKSAALNWSRVSEFGVIQFHVGRRQCRAPLREHTRLPNRRSA
jgi:phospholipid/cholesterol/gamma-HCH transport system ATP-binding protein